MGNKPGATEMSIDNLSKVSGGGSRNFAIVGHRGQLRDVYVINPNGTTSSERWYASDAKKDAEKLRAASGNPNDFKIEYLATKDATETAMKELKNIGYTTIGNTTYYSNGYYETI